MKKSGKPKGPVPSLIGSTLGRPKQVVVEKKCCCKRCGADMEKGTHCFAIPQLGGTFQNYRRYCDACFEAILKKTAADLNELVKASTRKAETNSQHDVAAAQQ